MESSGHRWVDGEAGPVIRPYALVGGRTQPLGGSFDLIAMVTVRRRAVFDPSTLEPAHQRVLSLCRDPMAVADLAVELDLPVGVIQVIVGDLREQGIITVQEPVPPSQMVDTTILRRVAEGLRRL